MYPSPGKGVLDQQSKYRTSEGRMGPERVHEPAKGVFIRDGLW